MLIKKASAKGIDIEIERLQDMLHAFLIAAWGIQSSSYKCYGRAYRNKTNDGYVAEWYKGQRQYEEVYWDDKLAACSFFGLSDKIEVGSAIAAEMHLVFFVNLDKVKPTATDRADDEVRAEVVAALNGGLASSVITSVELTVERALKEYPGSLRENRLKYVDMHPVHCFRVNMEINWENIAACQAVKNL